MARTLLQVQQQIADLKVIEERLKTQEAAGVVARIKEAIAAYGFTPDQLFGDTVPAVDQETRPMAKSSPKPRQKVQYADNTGNKWTGRGPRPTWLRQAVESGKPLSEFAVSREAKKKAKALDAAASVASDPQDTAPTKSRGGAGKKRAVKYRDGDGNTWSGGGSQPRWLRAALAAGKDLEEFRA